MSLTKNIESLKIITSNVLKDLSSQMNDLKKSISKEDKDKCDRWLKRYQESIEKGTPPPPTIKF